jgi:hypothetical protein
MRGNPDGFLSSPGRFATGLLSFRYTVGTFCNEFHMRRLADDEDKVAAGVNPAARATSVCEREPRWFSLIARSLRDGAALLSAEDEDKVAAGVNPAARATSA